MTRVVVVYHSGYGRTQRLAQHVSEGANATLIAIDSNGNLPEKAWDTFAAADTVVFGSPTYMGGPSWQFKKFADASSKPWFAGTWRDKTFGGFTNSASLNGDKHGTLLYFVTLAAQHGGLWVSLGLMPNNAKASTREHTNNLGASLGALAQSPSDAGVAEMSSGDLETGRLYGARVAGIAARLKNQTSLLDPFERR